MTDRIIVFGREPLPGRVKTRLIPALGARGAARLYRHLLERTLRVAAAQRECSIELWCCPDTATHAVCRSLAGDLGIACRFQQGSDLGARMLHAFAITLRQVDRVILIGSDCPAYDAGYLGSAFSALDEHDAVVGPAQDGGYVLLGLTKVDRRLFDELPWSTSAVLGKTRQRLRALGWCWSELDSLRDLDTPGDFDHYAQREEILIDCTAATIPVNAET